MSLQSKGEASNAKVAEELKLLNEKFTKLEADAAVTKSTNSMLSSRFFRTEKKCSAWQMPSTQEERRSWNKGVPSLNFNVRKDDLDACHCLKNKERVIIKFYRRNNFKKILKLKNELRKLNTTNIDLPQGSMGRKPKFVLVLYYRLFWSSSKKL